MSLIRAAIWLIVLLALPRAGPLAAVPAAAAEPAAAFRLANGLQVVVLPDHRLPVVTHAVYYQAGSADDPVGETGIAHYLEHLMFKGTKRYPTGTYDRIVNLAGGINNAFTSPDKTYYYEQVLKEGLPRIMDLDADRMADLDFPVSEAEHELKVVLEERHTYDNDPESVLSEDAGRTLYGKGPYAHPVLGDPADTPALTMAAALDFHHRFYAPGTAIVVVAGDVDPDAVRKMAEATYGRLAPGPAPPRPWITATPGCAEGRLEERHPRVARDKLTYYYLTPGSTGMGVRTAAALQLLAELLQDQGVSPLWQNLVARSGLAGDLAVSHELRLASGEFSISLEAESGISARRLDAALHDAIAELRRTGLKAEGLAAAKRRWLSETLLAADDQLGRATHYGEQLAIGRRVEDIEAEPQTIKDVSLADLNAVLRDFLSNRCYVSALLEHGQGPDASGGSGIPAHSTSSVH